MKIPKKLKVGSHTYTVTIAKGDGELSEPKYWGKTDYKNCSINLKSEIPKSKQEETFIHEILHICFDQAGIERPEPEEEYLVNSIANQLYQILKQNKLI